METPEERVAKALKKYGRKVPAIFGDPLATDIPRPNDLLADQSTGHIAAYSLGYFQELAARVKRYCEDPGEPEESKRRACQLLVNIAADAVWPLHQMFVR